MTIERKTVVQGEGGGVSISRGVNTEEGSVCIKTELDMSNLWKATVVVDKEELKKAIDEVAGG